ncbi:OCIA domain-containing protein 1-like [Saccoglossus kowalevskii]|uniref:OCIA domain-containing protein 1-like n=1 Tax=Saccoglossus kowalevskii TaxID=10224 RepID=A0ABM0GMB8_SACKO|nr:PREDICTED: OCIA domain-containing protein 1-like [Saccoglossus kowalevskii]
MATSHPEVGADHGPGGSPGPPYSRRFSNKQAAPYVFSEEEKMVLKECSKMSSIRAVFGSACFASLAFFLVKSGKISASPKYGPVPKMLYASFFGYVFGKISYINECKEKMMKLENSPLAEAIRNKRSFESLRQSDSQQDQTEYGATSSVLQYESTNEMPLSSPDVFTNMDVDPTKEPSQRDDQNTVSAFGPIPLPEDEKVMKPKTYEELRKKHRQESRAPSSYGYGLFPSSSRTPEQSTTAGKKSNEFNSDEYFGSPSTAGKHVNKYGDVIDD